MPTDDRKPKKIPLNEANFARKEFQALWGRINHRAVYQVEFDSGELIRKAIGHLDKHLNVAALQYVVQAGQQREQLEADDLTSGAGFAVQTKEPDLLRVLPTMLEKMAADIRADAQRGAN